LIETQDQLVPVVQANVGLDHKDVLIAADLVGAHLRGQQILDGGRLRKEVRRIDDVRDIRTLAIESREEKGAVLLERSAERPAKLVDL